MNGTFSEFPEIQSGFSAAADGTMAIVGGLENRQRYLAVHGCDSTRTVHAGLSHGVGVAVVTHDDGGRIMADTDGLITADVDVCLAMTAADCLLISVYDPVQHMIGMVHAGSKGLAQNVVSVFLQVWENVSPTDPRNLLVDISPSICPTHYMISLTDAERFSAWPDACQRMGELVFLDLRAVAIHQLTAGGVPRQRITLSPRCTYEDRQLFSYRRDHPEESQLQVGYMVRRSDE